MKKFLLRSLFIVIILSSYVHATPSPFHSGFRVGVESGYKHHFVNQKVEFQPGAALLGLGLGFSNETPSKKSRENTGSFGLHLAYDWFFDPLYTSLEFGYRYGVGTNKSTLQFKNQPGGFPQETFRFEQTHRHDFGVNFHLGSKIIDPFLLYGIFSLRCGNFEDKVKILNSGSPANAIGKSKKETRLGYGFGLGGRYAFPSQFSVSLEGTYDIYKAGKDLDIIGPAIPALDPAAKLVGKMEKARIFNFILKISKSF